MSDLGIFSLLVVGRDMPHPFARMTDAIPRPAERATPIAQQRRSGSRAKMIEPIPGPGGESISKGSGRLS